MNDNLSNIAVVRASWSAIICKYKYSLCVFCPCCLSAFSLCVFYLCFLSVLSVCVIYLCFLSVFLIRLRLLPHYQNDTFLSINFDSILLWSGLADQLLFADINSQFIWLQYKYKILTRYFGLSGSPASSSNCFFEPPRQGGLAWCHESFFELVYLGWSKVFNFRSCDCLSPSCLLHVPGLVSRVCGRFTTSPAMLVMMVMICDDDVCVSNGRRNCVMKTQIETNGKVPLAQRPALGAGNPLLPVGWAVCEPKQSNNDWPGNCPAPSSPSHGWRKPWSLGCFTGSAHSFCVSIHSSVSSIEGFHCQLHVQSS